MHKRQFEAIALAVYEAHARAASYVDREPRHRALRDVAERLAVVCAASNPRFDRARFLAACGVE